MLMCGVSMIETGRISTKNMCRSNCGYDEKVQTEVTCGTKG